MAAAVGALPAAADTEGLVVSAGGVDCASMKYGATWVKPRLAAMADTSREYHWFAVGLLWRRNAPPGSVMRNRPVTAAPEPPGWTRVRSSADTKPRFTSTMLPSPACSGVSTQ